MTQNTGSQVIALEAMRDAVGCGMDDYHARVDWSAIPAWLTTPEEQAGWRVGWSIARQHEMTER